MKVLIDEVRKEATQFPLKLAESTPQFVYSLNERGSNDVWFNVASGYPSDYRKADTTAALLVHEHNTYQMLFEGIKEVTNQMHNEGNGEHSIPSWFARELYALIKLAEEVEVPE